MIMEKTTFTAPLHEHIMFNDEPHRMIVWCDELVLHHGYDGWCNISSPLPWMQDEKFILHISGNQQKVSTIDSIRLNTKVTDKFPELSLLEAWSHTLNGKRFAITQSEKSPALAKEYPDATVYKNARLEIRL
jgi:hypothetical protein